MIWFCSLNFCKNLAKPEISKFAFSEIMSWFIFRFLETQQVLSEMDRLLNKIASDPLADLVLPGFIKFFGKLESFTPIVNKNCINKTRHLF